MGLFAKIQGFGFDPAFQEGLAVKLRCAINVKANDRKYAAPRSYDCWVIDCIGRGNDGFSWIENSGWFPRRQGTVHLYSPGTLFGDDNSHETEPHESSYILFDGGELLGLNSLTGDSGFCCIHDPGLEIYRRMTAIGNLSGKRGNNGVLTALGLFYAMADFLLEYTEADAGYERHVIENSAGAGMISRRLRGYLERHYQRQLTLPEIAKELGMSESGLSHRCRAETGQSVMNLLNGIRIEQSLPLLQRGMRFKEIAGASGFSDEFHYSKVFKRHMGCSPRDYIQSLFNRES